MNKKLIIQIIIIVAAFGAAGYVLYTGFFGGGGSPDSGSAGLVSAAKTPKDILPYGSTLDFGVLKSGRFVFGQLQYPKLDVGTEIGISKENLISSPQSSQASNNPGR